jgi:hypothetical protein
MMVNTMLAIRIEQTWYTDEAEQSETPSTYQLHELPDGRLAPIESGGLVELALNELGANLVDFAEDSAPSRMSGLN